MIDRKKLIALALATLMLSACAGKPERVVLLPQDGRATSLVVTGSSGGQVTLNEPYAEATVTPRETKSGKTDAESVARRYGSTLSATPLAPKRFVLYFVTGSNDLTKESASELPRIVAEITHFPAAEVVVIGHTDRVGSLESNDTLSLRRAQVMRDRIIAAGVPADRIITAGRGEREPVVATANEVASPQNRRVEIKLR